MRDVMLAIGRVALFVGEEEEVLGQDNGEGVEEMATR
jgi:hypothetical protein